ncbi:MAG: hypothetical protein V4850_12580 [Myxococcota bacterium]
MRTFHLTFATRGRQPVAPDESIRRALVRVIVRVAGISLVLFCVVDDHVHVVVLCTREVAGRLAQSLVLALRGASPVPVRAADITPVNSRPHMVELLRYVLTQSEHHGLAAPAALWSGSCFPDLVGARVIEGWRYNIREALPRFRRRDAYVAVGLPAEPLEPVSIARVRELGAWRLAEAAAGAVGVGPTLIGRAAPVVAARRVVVQLGLHAGIGPSEIGAALELTRWGVSRLGAGPSPAAEVRATRLRLALEDAVVRLPMRLGAAAG